MPCSRDDGGSRAAHQDPTDIPVRITQINEDAKPCKQPTAHDSNAARYVPSRPSNRSLSLVVMSASVMARGGSARGSPTRRICQLVPWFLAYYYQACTLLVNGQHLHLSTNETRHPVFLANITWLDMAHQQVSVENTSQPSENPQWEQIGQ